MNCFKTWIVIFPFLPGNDEQNTPKRHILIRPKGIKDQTLFPAFHVPFPLSDHPSAFFAFNQHPVKTPPFIMPLFCAQSGDTRKH